MLGREELGLARSYFAHVVPWYVYHMFYIRIDELITTSASGVFESNGPCPASHPVAVPQLMYEVIFATELFNDTALWPTDGSQPFRWSFDDA